MESQTYNIYFKNGTKREGIKGILDISNGVVRFANEEGDVFAILNFEYIVNIDIIRKD